MKRLIYICILFFTCLSCFSQTDTIFTGTDKIACKVIKLRTDSIKYKIPPAETVYLISKKDVDKIIYKNGKVFSVKEDISMQHVEGVSNFNDVAITFIESDVKDFTKIMDVEIKYQHVTLTSQDNALDKAYRLLKIQAAMKGANIIYIPEQPTLKMSVVADTTVTKLYGIAYCDVLPTIENLEKLIGEKNDFNSTIQWYKNIDRQDVYQLYFNGKFTVNEIFVEEGIVYIEGELKSFPKIKTFRLVSISSKSFMLYFDMGEVSYNVRVDL